MFSTQNGDVYFPIMKDHVCAIVTTAEVEGGRQAKKGSRYLDLFLSDYGPKNGNQPWDRYCDPECHASSSELKA